MRKKEAYQPNIVNNTIVKHYPVSGMSCASCSTNVESVLNKQPES
jgi:hypothetical protein